MTSSALAVACGLTLLLATSVLLLKKGAFAWDSTVFNNGTNCLPIELYHCHLNRRGGGIAAAVTSLPWGCSYSSRNNQLLVMASEDLSSSAKGLIPCLQSPQPSQPHLNRRALLRVPDMFCPGDTGFRHMAQIHIPLIEHGCFQPAALFWVV